MGIDIVILFHGKGLGGSTPGLVGKKSMEAFYVFVDLLTGSRRPLDPLLKFSLKSWFILEQYVVNVRN